MRRRKALWSNERSYRRKRIQECQTYKEIHTIIDDWMDYYNNDRYQWRLAKLSPNEYYQYITTGIYPIKGENPFIRYR